MLIPGRFFCGTSRAFLAAAAVAWLATTAGCSGCKSNKGRQKRRAPAVVVVDPEQLTAPLSESEPNDARPQAMLLPPGRAVAATISSTSDADWYKIVLAAPPQVASDGGVSGVRILRATASGHRDLDLRLAAFDAAGKFLVNVDNTGLGEGETLVNLAIAPGTVYLRVSLASKKRKRKSTKKSAKKGRLATAGAPTTGAATTGTYRLSYALRQPEPGEEREPNWKRSLSSPLALGEEAVGYFGWRTDADWYRIALDSSVGATDRLRVELDGVDGVWPSLSLYTAGGRRIQSRRGRPGDTVVLAGLLRPAGTHVYVVARCGRTFNAEVRYSLRVSASPAAGGSEVEPNDRVARATALPLDQPIAGLLADVYDRDIFALKVDRPALLRVIVSPPLALDPALALLDEQGKVIIEIDQGRDGKAEALPAYYVEPPRVLLRVRARRPLAVDPVGTYRLRAQLLPAAAFEREPNNKAELATTWAVGVAEVGGYVHPKKDVDFFLVSGSGSVAFSALPPDGVELELALLSGERVLATSAVPDSTGRLRVAGTAPAGVKVLLRVRTSGRGSAQRPYRLRREAVVAPVAPLAPLP